ncbi:hypothetical protein ACFU80_21940, partial [Streptomyces erythrochromogenes]
MALSHESPGAGSVSGRPPQGAERTTAAPTDAENRSPGAAPAGAGSVSGRSPQGAERTTVALSDPEN